MLATLPLVLLAGAACRDETIELRADRVLRGSVETPRPQSVPPRLHAFSARRLFVWAPAGRVLETTDAGKTWRRVRIHAPYGPPRFLTRSHWLASHGRRLYRTQDAGRTWRFAHRLAKPLRAEGFVSGELAYACGAHGCAVSSDGGRTIARVPSPDPVRCGANESRSAAFSDARHGLMICGGVPGAGHQLKGAWATSDGRSWRRLPEPPTYGYVGRIDALGRDVFVHHSARASDLLTVDGGLTWRAGLAAESTTTASWVTARIAWALDGRGSVFRTVDGGRRWHFVAPSFWPYGPISFCDRKTGFGTGHPDVSGWNAGPTVYATADGGRTWSRRSVLRRFDLASLVCVTPRVVFAIGYGTQRPLTRVLRSQDGGRRWTPVRYPSEAYAPTISSPRVLHAPEYRGVVHATADGGRTWRRLRPDPYRIDAVAFASPQVGFVVAGRERPGKREDPRRLLRTTDRGRTWKRVPIRIPRLSIGGLVAARGTLWMSASRCGRPGALCKPLLLRTRDAGRRWELIELDAQAPEGARFSSPSVGVAAGLRGLYVTRDGGVTWRWEARGGF